MARVKCPGCNARRDEDDILGQREHMMAEHPEIVERRLVDAGFERDERTGVWVDTLTKKTEEDLMSGKRKKRLLNGQLRPAVRRAKQKQGKRRREAWLANFKPGERDRFLNHVDLNRAVWLARFARDTGLDRADAAALLEKTATERQWRKLRTLDGTVVGIAPPKNPRPEVTA